MTNETIDIEEQEQEDLLYEHFRMEVDKGQVPIRIDKYLVVTVSSRLPMQVLYM